MIGNVPVGSYLGYQLFDIDKEAVEFVFERTQERHVVKHGLDWTKKTRTESVVCKTWTQSVFYKSRTQSVFYKPQTQSVICTKIRQKPCFCITIVHWAKIFNTSELGN